MLADRFMATRSIPNATPGRCRLLYVGDDDASFALIKQVIAGRKDLALCRAADIDGALQLARRRHPELMLVDADLVADGGVPLLKILRANANTRTMPILAAGSNTAPAATVKSLEAGFFVYLAKPMQAGPLGEALDYALEFAALEEAEQAGKDTR
jgi:DNA-binding response OmpR family regulator